MVSKMLFVFFLVAVLSALTLAWAAGPKRPPDSNAARPPVDQGGFVSHTEEVTIQVPPQFLQEWRQGKSLETQLRGSSRIAGVARTEMIQGTWGEVGARRRVVRKDGNRSLEEILENTPPTLFRYEVWGFTDRAGLLTNYFVGEFQHREVPGGTLVKWTYSFHRRSLLTEPFLSIMVRSRIPEFMRSTLQRTKQEAEQAYREQPE